MLRAVAAARNLGLLAVVLVGLVVVAYESVVNALWYREVDAVVEKVEQVCIPPGEDDPVSCDQVVGSLDGTGGVRKRFGVQVRYTSPADGRSYAALLSPWGTRPQERVRALSPSDHWPILASTEDPQDVKPN